MSNGVHFHQYADDTQLRLAMAYSLILTRLDYSNSKLCDAPVCSIQKLQRVQNNAARIVLQAPRRSHARPLMCQLHWLPVQHRIDYKVSVLTYKTLNTVPQPTHQPPRQRTDTTLDGYATAHPTFRSHRLRDTFSLSALKSRLKHTYFASPISSTHHRLPPAPPKLRLYGALQICLLLLLLASQISMTRLRMTYTALCHSLTPVSTGEIHSRATAVHSAYSESVSWTDFLSVLDVVFES